MSWVVILHLMQSLRAQLIPFSIYLYNENLVLIGDETSILKKLDEMKVEPSLFEIVHTSQVIEMARSSGKSIFTEKRFKHCSRISEC